LRNEARQLQTRFEFFNVFNHTNFSIPSTANATMANATLTSGTFGTLSPPTRGQRTIQVALKLLFSFLNSLGDSSPFRYSDPPIHSAKSGKTKARNVSCNVVITH